MSSNHGTVVLIDADGNLSEVLDVKGLTVTLAQPLQAGARIIGGGRDMTLVVDGLGISTAAMLAMCAAMDKGRLRAEEFFAIVPPAPKRREAQWKHERRGFRP